MSFWLGHGSKRANTKPTQRDRMRPLCLWVFCCVFSPVIINTASYHEGENNVMGQQISHAVQGSTPLTPVARLSQKEKAPFCVSRRFTYFLFFRAVQLFFECCHISFLSLANTENKRERKRKKETFMLLSKLVKEENEPPFLVNFRADE